MDLYLYYINRINIIGKYKTINIVRIYTSIISTGLILYVFIPLLYQQD
jgi:hypothetical protein